MTTNTDGTEVAVFHAIGFGRMSVTEDMSGCAYTFRITGRTNTPYTISDEEAATLAEAILERTR
jgi:hypothetical protein